MRLDLTGATLIDLNFYRAVVADARFVGATFTGTAQFYGAIFGAASFHGANFTEDAAFSRADFTGRADFSEAAIADKYGITATVGWSAVILVTPAGPRSSMPTARRPQFSTSRRG